MIVIKLDVFDGNPVEMVVKDNADAYRLYRFSKSASDSFANADRWWKIRRLMTHEKSGPHVGWTLSVVMPGDDPEQAIDNFDTSEAA